MRIHVRDTIPTGPRRNSGHEGTNIPNVPEESNNEGASRFPRILLERIPGIQSFRGWHPVIDLKGLNTHIYAPHFLMFTISLVPSTVREGDYTLTIDLQDVYFHVPIHPSSRKYPRFAFENKVYQF